MDCKEAYCLKRTISLLQNVFIWYDGFISSGEKWRDRIGDALKNKERCQINGLMELPGRQKGFERSNQNSRSNGGFHREYVKTGRNF